MNDVPIYRSWKYSENFNILQQWFLEVRTLDKQQQDPLKFLKCGLSGSNPKSTQSETPGERLSDLQGNKASRWCTTHKHWGVHCLKLPAVEISHVCIRDDSRKNLGWSLLSILTNIYFFNAPCITVLWFVNRSTKMVVWWGGFVKRGFQKRVASQGLSHLSVQLLVSLLAMILDQGALAPNPLCLRFSVPISL